jgi:hypothetical protein
MGEITLVVRLTVEDSDLKTFDADLRGRITLGKEHANETVTIVVPEPSQGIDEIQPFHVRHHPGPDLSEDSRRAMAADRRFGIHWGNQILTSKWFYHRIAHENAAEGEQARGPNDDINNMHRVSENGGLITAEYRNIWPSITEDVMLLGRVTPNTPIEPQEYEFDDGEMHYMKTIKMVDVVEASKTEYPELWEKMPKRGSIRRWKSNPDVPRSVYQDLC